MSLHHLYQVSRAVPVIFEAPRAARIAIAVNDINRALDNSDLYPFVLTPTIREKIGFAHRWLKHHAEQGA